MEKKWICCTTEELGESWEVLADEKEKNNPNFLISKKGNRAIMKFVYDTTDYVLVTILPAAKIKESKKELKKDCTDKDLFHIKLSLINGDQWFALSKYKFKKEEAIKLASLFIGLTKHQAERVWISKKLGDLNTNILCHSYQKFNVLVVFPSLIDKKVN